MANTPDKISELFGLLPEGTFKDENELRGYVTDEAKLKDIYGLLDEGTFKDEQEYNSYFGDTVKKKASPLELASQGQTVFQELGQPLADSSTQKLPSQLRIVNQEETLAEQPTVSSVLKAQQNIPQYLKGKQDELEKESIQGIKDEIKKLQENYKKKVEANPEKKRELQKEFEAEQDRIIELRSASIPMAVESLYKKGKDYKYIDPADAKTLADQAKEVSQSNRPYEEKKVAIQQLQDEFYSTLQGVPEEELKSIKREVSDIIAQNSVLTEQGMPSVYGWKQEVSSKKETIQTAMEEMLAKRPDLRDAEAIAPLNPAVMNDKDVKQFLTLKKSLDAIEQTLQLPDDGGNFWDGFKSQGRAMATMGLSDFFDALDIAIPLRKSANGEKLSTAEQALVDAYGIFQTAQNSDEIDKWYGRGKGIGQSVAFMESFAFTSGMGALGSKTAIKALGNQVKNKVVQNITKGVGSAVARTPFMVGGATDATKRMSGTPELNEQGEWKVDPETIEPVVKSIGKGLYSNFANALGETAGGWLAGTKVSKFIGQSLGVSKIPKGVSKIFDTVGMQPLGELPEEYLTTLMETPVMGDQSLKEAFSAENVWETAVQVGLVSGFFGGMALPSTVSENVQRSKNAEIVKLFGKDNVSALRTAIESNDKKAFGDAIKLSFEGKTEEDLGMSLEKAQRRLVGYANSLAQEKGTRVVQEAIKVNQAEQLSGGEVSPKVEFYNGFTADVRIRTTGNDRIEVKDDKGEVAGSFALKTKVVDGEAYYEGGLLYTRPEFEGNGLGQNMVKLAMESLPEEYKGLFFPAETIINKTQIPRIFEKLGKTYDVTTNEKGDVFIKPKAQVEVSEGGTETKVEQTPIESTPVEETTPEIKQEITAELPTELPTESPVEQSLEEKHGAFTVESLNERAQRLGLSNRDMGTDVIDQILNAKAKGLTKEVAALESNNKEAWEQLKSDAFQINRKKPRVDVAKEESIKSEDNIAPEPIIEQTEQSTPLLQENTTETKPIQETEETPPSGIEDTQATDIIPEQVQNNPVEPLQDSGEGNIPPTGDNGSQASKQDSGKERERGYFKQLMESSQPSKELKESLTEAGLTYKVLSNKETSENIDYVLSQLGFEKAWEQVKDLNSDISWATRRGLSLRMTFHYDRLAQKAMEEGNLEESASYRKKAFEVADFADQLGTETGQFNQYAGSAESVTMLSPSSNVARETKRIRKQRTKKLKDNAEDIKEKKEGLRKANKEAIDEVIASKEFEDLKKRIAELEKKLAEKPKPTKPPVTPKEKDTAKKIKDIDGQIKDKWGELGKAWRDLKEQKKSGSVGFAANAQEELVVKLAGDIFRLYIKKGVYKTEELLNKFKKDWFKVTGDIIADDDAMKYMPTEVDGKPITEALAENESKEIADRLVARVKKLLEDPKTPKNDPIKQLIDTLFGKITEKDTKEKPERVKKTNVDKIREAIEDKERYADTWETAKEKVLVMIETNEELSEDQKSDQKKRLQAFFEEVIGRPYSEKQVEGAVKEKVKELEVSIDKIVRQHYTVQDATGRSLAQKLVDELGLSGEQADLLAKAVQDKFNKIATEKKRKILLQGIKNRARAVNNPKQIKAEWEKFIELTNMGAFTNAEFAEAYADIYGFPTLTDQNKADLLALAEKVQSKDGFKKDEAVQDYLNYIAKLPGLDLGEVAMSIWYANVLSGERTQFKNFLGNFTNTIAEFGVAMTYNLFNGNFSSIPFMVNAMWNAGGIAKAEFSHTLKTGYAPIRYNKIESSNYMERWRFRGKANPLNAPKYVSRLMMGVDTFFYTGLKELRASELAMREARKENAEATMPTMSNWALATEKLYGTAQRRAEAEVTADNEGLKGNERKKRVWELMEKSRGTEIITESNNFASRGTYNYKPEGAIGSATDAIGRWFGNRTFTFRNRLTGKPVNVRYGKFFVPFTRIIANVANTALDYFPPTGFERARVGYIGSESEESHYRKYTNEERAKIAIKAGIGTISMITLYMLSEPPEDPDEEPYITITSNGHGDYAKNEELKGTGWQQYSIKVGDRWWSYQYTPLFVALAPIGFIRDVQKYKKADYKDMNGIEKATSILFTPLQVISDMTVLTSIAGLLGAVTGEGYTAIDSFFKRFATGTIKGFTYPKVIEQTNQMIDDMLNNPRRYSSSYLGKVFKDTRTLKNYFPVQYNYAGEPVVFDAVQMTEKTTGDPYSNWLSKNGLTVGTVAQKGDFAIIYDEAKKVERGMNDVEFMDFTREANTQIKSRAMTELMVKDMPEDELRQDYNNIKSDVRRQVKTELFGWGEYRTKYPDRWDTLRKNRAVQIPIPLPKEGELSSAVKWMTDDGEVAATREEVQRLNDAAMDIYYESVVEYLKEEPDRTLRNEATGEFIYVEGLQNLWLVAKKGAKGLVIEERSESDSKKTK